MIKAPALHSRAYNNKQHETARSTRLRALDGVQSTALCALCALCALW